eukprot:scaffold4703_cov166-Amphora_coffeaeformis.AAC.3
MPTLDGAITFPQMYHITRSVTNNLNFNMTRTIDEAFDKDTAVPKRGQGFRCGGFVKGNQIFHASDDTHTFAPTSHGSLEDDGQANRFNKFLHFFRRAQGPVGSGHDGDTGFNGGLTGTGLVGKAFQIFHGRSDKGNARRGTGLGKFGTFRQETITGMNGIDTGLFGNFDDILNVEVGRNGCGGFFLFQ